MYYAYHNRIKQRIRNGELIGSDFVKNYPHIGECMVLHFSTPPFIRPIKPSRYVEYLDILQEWKDQT